MASGVEPMAGHGSFQAALHDIYEEADDEPAAVGLFADDIGERLVGCGMGFRYEHLF